MRVLTTFVSAILVLLAASTAHAGSSCSVFAKVTGFDDASTSITLKRDKGSEAKYFPKTDGAPATSKIPKGCKGNIWRQKSFEVKPTGGRMTITQIRSNFSGKMLNDVDDETWLPAKMKELVKSGDTLVVILRQPPGSDRRDPYAVTTIYMPITDEELKEIERLNAQAEDT